MVLVSATTTTWTCSNSTAVQILGKFSTYLGTVPVRSTVTFSVAGPECYLLILGSGSAVFYICTTRKNYIPFPSVLDLYGIGLNKDPDPDPAFEVNADPDPGSFMTNIQQEFFFIHSFHHILLFRTSIKDSQGQIKGCSPLYK